MRQAAEFLVRGKRVYFKHFGDLAANAKANIQIIESDAIAA